MRHKTVNIAFAATAITLALLSLFASWSWWVFGVSLVVWMAIVVVGSAWIGSNYHVKAYCSGETSERKIALTFDDGPTIFTIFILEKLREYKVKATFFCIGKQIEKHPDIFAQIVSDGHLVGNHSFYHGKDFDWKNSEQVLSELNQTNAFIEEISGKKPRFFRPPYGVTNPSIATALKATKQLVIGWNIRSMDGVSQNEDAIYERIVRQIKPGAIVLMHDTSQVSTNVLERILLTLRDQNFKIVPVDELLGLNAYEED